MAAQCPQCNEEIGAKYPTYVQAIEPTLPGAGLSAANGSFVAIACTSCDMILGVAFVPTLAQA